MTLAIILLIVAALLALGWADHRHRAEVRRTRRRVRRFTGER